MSATRPYTIEINVAACPRCGKGHDYTVEIPDPTGPNDLISLKCLSRTRLWRLTSFDFDFTRSQANRVAMSDSALQKRYGELEPAQLRTRWLDASESGIWVFMDYREKMKEITDAYVRGNFFCAVTATCCLMERVLNQLVIELRDEFPANSTLHDAIYRNSHIQNWKACWEALKEWKVLNDSQVTSCKTLHRIRNDVCHFEPGIDFQLQASTVIRQANEFFDSLFNVHRREDLFRIYEVPGEIWIRAEKAAHPFVRKFILQHCTSISALGQFVGNEYIEYDTDVDEISEEEFIRRRRGFDWTAGIANAPAPALSRIEIDGKTWTIRVI